MAEGSGGESPGRRGSGTQNWVKFDEEGKAENSKEEINSVHDNSAVIETESVQVSFDHSGRKTTEQIISPASLEYDVKNTKPPPSSRGDVKITMSQVLPLHTVPLNEGTSRSSSVANTPTPSRRIQTGLSNGDVIVTLLPLNTKWPWVTPAQFRPELVPEELMAEGLTLTVEEYVQTMELLVNDFRFTIYNICYKRILMGWIMLGFVILLALFFSGIKGMQLFGAGVLWLIFNAAAIFLCMWIKVKLNRNLERCMAGVNKNLLKHKIVLGLDDRGKLSCHKVNLCFIYFNTENCIRKLAELIEKEDAAGRIVNSEETEEEKKKKRDFRSKMDIDDHDIIITGTTNRHISRRQERAQKLLLRYLQRWAKDLLRNRLDWSVDFSERLSGPGLGGPGPRHLSKARCPCQYIEEHLRYKPPKIVVPGSQNKCSKCCNNMFNLCHSWADQGALD